MNAFEVPGHVRFSLDAASPVTLRRFLKVNSSSQVEHATAAGEPIVGVSYTEATAAGRPVSIVGDGIVLVEAGETIAAGDLVGAGADGKAMKTGGVYPAITGGDAGDEISVLLSNVAGTAGA